MKIGVRKSSLKKSIKARTTGKLKRAVKKSVNPLYGKKGMGYINDPKKAVYNKIYNKTTIGVNDVARSMVDSSHASGSSKSYQEPPSLLKKIIGILGIIVGVIAILIGLICIAFGGIIFIIGGVILLLFSLVALKSIKKEVEE